VGHSFIHSFIHLFISPQNCTENSGLFITVNSIVAAHLNIKVIRHCHRTITKQSDQSDLLTASANSSQLIDTSVTADVDWHQEDVAI